MKRILGFALLSGLLMADVLFVSWRQFSPALAPTWPEAQTFFSLPQWQGSGWEALFEHTKGHLSYFIFYSRTELSQVFSFSQVDLGFSVTFQQIGAGLRLLLLDPASYILSPYLSASLAAVPWSVRGIGSAQQNDQGVLQQMEYRGKPVLGFQAGAGLLLRISDRVRFRVEGFLVKAKARADQSEFFGQVDLSGRGFSLGLGLEI